MNYPASTARRNFVRAIASLLALGAAACSTAAPTQSPAAQQSSAPPTQPAAAPKPAPATAAPAPTAAAAPKPTAPRAESVERTAPTPRQVVKWRIGLPSVPFFDHSFRMIGIKQGFYRDAGIDPDFVHASNVLQNKALIAGELDSIDLAIDGIMAAIEQGADLKIVGSVQPGLPYAIYSKKEIKTVNDLAGRTVAITGQGDFIHLVIRALLANAGIPEDRITIVALGQSGAPMIQALVAGKIDAFTNPIDYIKEIEKDPNSHVLAIVPDLLPNLVRTAVTVRGATAQQQGDALTRFLTAMLRSVRYAIEHKGDLLAEAEEHTKLPADQLAFLYDWYRDHKMWSPNLFLAPEAVAYMQDLNIRIGQQQKKLPIEQLLDLSFQKKVVAQLGEVKS